MGITFNYIPDYDVRMRAVEWFGYGLHPSKAQKIAELGRSVDDFMRDLARAKAEREELEWEGFKLTAKEIGMWAADFGDRVARLRHLTDAHLAQALAEEEAPQTAIFASIGWLLYFFVADLPNFQNIINYVLAYHDIIPKKVHKFFSLFPPNGDNSIMSEHNQLCSCRT